MPEELLHDVGVMLRLYAGFAVWMAGLAVVGAVGVVRRAMEGGQAGAWRSQG